MPSQKPIRVFYVDNDTAIAESIGKQLETQSAGSIISIGIETDAERAVEKVLELKPDVFLVDLSLRYSKFNGLAIGKIMRENLPECRLIAFTKERNYQPVRQALKLGFKGYLLKSDSMKELITAIKYVAEGGISISPHVSNFLVEDKYYESIKVLSANELRVAKMIKEGHENQDIAETLSVSTDTVKGYVSEILGKLGFKNRSQIAAYVSELEASGLWSLLLEVEPH